MSGEAATRTYLYDRVGIRVAHCGLLGYHNPHGFVVANEDLRCPGTSGRLLAELETLRTERDRGDLYREKYETAAREVAALRTTYAEEHQAMQARYERAREMELRYGREADDARAEVAALRTEREDAILHIGELSEGCSPPDLPGAVQWVEREDFRQRQAREAAEREVAALRTERDQAKRGWESASSDWLAAKEAQVAAAREVAALREALQRLTRELDDKYARTAKACADAAEDDYLDAYLDFEEGRREAFKWAANCARAVLGAAEDQPPAERDVLTLMWTCGECGWTRSLDAPGFAGDGVWHYPDGTHPCGPITAQRVSGAAREGQR